MTPFKILDLLHEVKRFTTQEENVKVTMKDIAKEAGVSITTVSHVINGTKKISEEKYQLINQIIEKYKYVPDLTAKHLRTQKTRTVGLVISSRPDSYVNGIVSSVGSRAREFGYNVLHVNTEENLDSEKATLHFLGSHLVDGLILSPTSSNMTHLEDLIQKQFPLVLVNRYDPSYPLPHVTADDFQAGYDATYHLLDHGHRHIGLIFAVSGVSTTIHRIEGYKKALEDFGLPYQESYIEHGHATVEGGLTAVRQLLTREKEITALFVLSDLMTIGCIKALNSLSRKCPDDVALIGFGDFEAATIINPPITNVSLPPDTIGRTAFDMLFNRMTNPSYAKSIQLPTSLIVRKSCGC
jgi:LacI family transcriptional regulator